MEIQKLDQEIKMFQNKFKKQEYYIDLKKKINKMKNEIAREENSIVQIENEIETIIKKNIEQKNKIERMRETQQVLVLKKQYQNIIQ